MPTSAATTENGVEVAFGALAGLSSTAIRLAGPIDFKPRHVRGFLLLSVWWWVRTFAVEHQFKRFVNKGTPIFYLYTDNGTITLCDHSGTPIKVGGKIFQAKLDRGENADEVAQALYRESRGEKRDHFDGPILYRDPPVPI